MIASQSAKYPSELIGYHRAPFFDGGFATERWSAPLRHSGAGGLHLPSRPIVSRPLDAKADQVGDPPSGDWGDAPDGIQYFEVQPGARSVLFVRLGQDEPLFDEKTLRLIK